MTQVVAATAHADIPEPPPDPPPAQPAPPPRPMQAPPEPAPPQAPPEPAPPQAATGPRVFLRIDRPAARLQQQTMLGWRDICAPPCGAVVDPSALYRVAGRGAMTSASFELPRASGDVYVDGHVATRGRRLVGFWLIIAGAITGVFGAIALINPVLGVNDNRRDDDANLVGGLVLLGITAGLEAIGISLFSSARTSIEVR